MHSSLHRCLQFWKLKLGGTLWQRRRTWHSLLLVLAVAWLLYISFPELILYRIGNGWNSLSKDSLASRQYPLSDHENGIGGLKHEIDKSGEVLSFNPKIAQAQLEHIRTSEDHEKCGALTECEDKKILISLYSGKQSVTSPYICINGRVIMSRETNGAGRGLNVIILEPLTGIVLRRLNFDTFLEKDDTALDLILSQLTTEQLVIVLTHDDASHGLSSAIKKTFQSLGSSMIDKLNFRGSWFFIGQKGIKGFSPFEDLHRSAEEMKWAPPVSAKMCVPYKLEGLKLPKSPAPVSSHVNERKESFCKSHDGYFEFCEDESFPDAFEWSVQPQSNVQNESISSVPILVIPGFDLIELCATLRSIVVQPGLDRSNVLVVYEGNFKEIKDLAEVFNFTTKLITSKPTYHEYVAEAIQSVWDAFPSSEYAIVIEEEAVLSPDFLSFMEQLLPVFKSEPKFVSISAWNVNGFKHLSNNTGSVYLTEGFPGFGFMMKRSFYMKNMKGRMDLCCNRRSWHGWNTSSSPTVYTLVPEISRISRKPYASSGRFSHDLAALFQYPRIMNSEAKSVISQVDQLSLIAYSKNIQSLIASTETLPYLNCTQDDQTASALPNVLPELRGLSIRLSKHGITMDSVCSCFRIYCPKDSSFRNYFNGILRFNHQGKSVFLIDD